MRIRQGTDVIIYLALVGIELAGVRHARATSSGGTVQNSVLSSLPV
jgi:hypothetical protein